VADGGEEQQRAVEVGGELALQARAAGQQRRVVVARHRRGLAEAVTHAAVQALGVGRGEQRLVQRARLEHDDRAARVHQRLRRLERRDAAALDARARGGQRVGRGQHPGAHPVGRVVEQLALGQHERQAGEARGRDRLRRHAAQRLVQRDRVGDGLRERADAVQRRGQREDAAAVDARRRRPEADDAAQRGGDPDRSGGVGADRQVDRACGDRDGRSRRRAARHARRLRVVRVARRAEVRVQAEARVGQLAQVRLADADQAGGGEVRDDRRVRGRGRGVAAERGARGGRGPGNVEQVLDGDGPPVERPARRALLVAEGAGGRLGAGPLGGEGDEGVGEVGIRRAAQRGLDGLHGAHGRRPRTPRGGR
jgi:hypothetical protein